MNAPDHKAVNEAIARMELRGDDKPPQFHADLDLITAELEKLRQRCEESENRWAAVFDGPAVFRMLTPRAAKFVSPECVSEVLDALVRVAANNNEATP